MKRVVSKGGVGGEGGQGRCVTKNIVVKPKGKVYKKEVSAAMNPVKGKRTQRLS